MRERERKTGESDKNRAQDRGPSRAEQIYQYSKNGRKEKDSGQELFWVGTKKPHHFADWVFSVKTQGLKHGCSLSAEKPFSEFCSLNGEKY